MKETNLSTGRSSRESVHGTHRTVVQPVEPVPDVHAEPGEPAGRPLRVLFVDHVAQLSGGELSLLTTVKALRPDVVPYVILGEDGPLRVALEQAGVRTEVLALADSAAQIRRDRAVSLGSVRSVGTLARYVITLARRMRALRPDLVHTASLKSGFYGATAARLAGVPVIWDVKDRIADDYMPGRAVAVTRAAVAHLPSGVLCNSEATRRTVEPLRTPVCVVPSPVDLTPYARPNRTTRRIEGATTVGVVGRLSPWKGQDVAMRAFARVYRGRPARLKIIGSAMFGEEAYEERLRQHASELGVTGQVDFCGFVADIPRALGGLDVLVHASVVPEPFGRVVVEGLAAGVPVIATAPGGPGEILEDGVTGLLVPPADVRAMAAALLRLESDPQLRESLSTAGRVRARDFSSELVAAKTLDFYRRVLGTRPDAPVHS